MSQAAASISAMLRKSRVSSAMSAASFRGDGAGPIHGKLAARTVLLDPLRKSDGAIDEGLPLPVDGDDVIAVVEHQHLHETAQPFLKIEGVLEAREVVLARVGDEDGTFDVLE